MNTLLITVTGRVQGVGFRAYVLSSAKVYGITGEVWNCRDGGVQLYAQHSDLALLERFAAGLRRGPGRVDGVASQPMAQPEFVDFTIGETR